MFFRCLFDAFSNTVWKFHISASQNLQICEKNEEKTKKNEVTDGGKMQIEKRGKNKDTKKERRKTESKQQKKGMEEKKGEQRGKCFLPLSFFFLFLLLFFPLLFPSLLFRGIPLSLHF